MSGRKGMKHYSESVKRETIKLYLEEGWSAEELQEKFDIYDRNRINRWVAKYREEGEGMFVKPERRGRKPSRKNKDAYIKWLEMENDLLKKFHTELHKEKLVKCYIGQWKRTEEDIK